MDKKYIQDIENYIESIPYGEVNLKVRRLNRKTIEIESHGEETLRYTDNDEAIRDIENMLKKLTETGYNGETHVKLAYKDGNIKIVGIFNKENAKYG